MSPEEDSILRDSDHRVSAWSVGRQGRPHAGPHRYCLSDQSYSVTATPRQENLCYDPFDLLIILALGVAQNGHDHNHGGRGLWIRPDARY